jgi:hypothetical protein
MGRRDHGSRFPAVGMKAQGEGACLAELPGEEPGPAADIDHAPTVQVQIMAELADGVAGEAGAVRRRCRLLSTERPEQAYRPRRIQPERGGRSHLPGRERVKLPWSGRLASAEESPT